ncbi:legumin1 [Zea mays]|uniref:Legumin1 n=1 Tax=Zea mays TaxID=4577 RepID=A0A1D6LI02_MAIZE|nr:legumin1 [Zea mays]
MAAAIVLSGQVRPLPSSLPLSLLLLLLLCCSGTSWGWSTSRGGAARECGFDGKLEALEPRHKVQSEAGSVQYFSRFNEADRELTCAGIFAVRVVVDAMGLLLPRYSNVHSLVYIVQGRGIIGFSFPGCQEETQQQQYGYGYGYGHHHHQHDHHKIHRFEQGDVVAMPAGAQHWLYNDGDAPLVAVYVFDENIFKGIDARFLSEALGVSMHVAEKLQSRRDQRGEIVRVEPEHGFHQLNPSPSSSSFSFPSSQVQYQTCQRDVDRHNVCAMEVRHSVERLDQADVYSPGAGRITRLTSHKFPVLNLVQMSAVRVDLYQDAIMSPFWNFNAHSAIDNGTTVFDDVLRAGQLLIVPQGYLVATKAQGEGFQYIAFETNPDTMVSHVAGKNSVLSDLPAAVIASSYAISMEEAAELKNGRKHELAVLTPAGSGSYQQGQAGSAQQ